MSCIYYVSSYGPVKTKISYEGCIHMYLDWVNYLAYKSRRHSETILKHDGMTPFSEYALNVHFHMRSFYVFICICFFMHVSTFKFVV